MTLKHVVCQCICLNSSKGILIIDKRMCTLDYANSNTELLQSVFSMIMLNSSKCAYYQKKFSREPLSKSCELDPLPVVVLKGCLTVLLPTITRIINLSLSTGVVPDALKVSILLPTLKKSDADFEQFQNFRPISNLKVVSKLVEKAVDIQLTDHVMAHHLDETFQSAYKNFRTLHQDSFSKGSE